MSRVALVCVCLLAAVSPALAQPSSLADLIRAGNRKAALDSIRAGADVNAAQPDGTRPIHWAVYKVDFELIDALIAKKARVDVANEFGATPLGEAVKLADARMVKTLVAAGAGVDRADENGQTALMLAVKTGELPIVEMLVKVGANVNAVETFQRQTPLMWAVTAPKHAAEMTKLLLARGADPNMAVPGDGNPLIMAAREGHVAIVELLLKRGVNVDQVVPSDENALIQASGSGQLAVVKLLVSAGADVNARVWAEDSGARATGEWRTPLSMARRHGDKRVIDFLVASGAR